ncbi:MULTISPECIES: galactosyltransferase-related protein [Priestia]|uniref:galactosyltransferase-related protein n=1 Tax=Priestia TaxID=2800373 RepID=UPI001C8F1182|nr:MULTISPECIES: galactosyltransferase-related protein [Priestia]MBY0065342.1 hypothetical protein [Priestia aryabhattai]MDN3365459.1 galactosyltransferase-related protein [Priestia megaterium]MEB4871368.1 galactosyltransferase-related protein [Priestia megaterium]WKU26125.1 galactosyltransferase-related protein [Priestia megaterium]
MLNQVSVLIPYKPDKGIRDKLFRWVISYYKNVMPEVELCIGRSKSEPFNRSQAINRAAKKATRPIFVIADADVIYSREILIKAIPLLSKHAWIIPYGKWLDISQASTAKLLVSSPKWPFSTKVKSTERFGNKTVKPVSGVVVVSRKNFNSIKGFDERFRGWGREDNAFRDAMNTLCGPYKRINSNSIYHLWHPKVGPKGNPNIQNNNNLYKKYEKANGNAKQMKKLINERKK